MTKNAGSVKAAQALDSLLSRDPSVNAEFGAGSSIEPELFFAKTPEISGFR